MKKFTSEISAKKQDYGDIIVTVHDKYGNLLQRVEQTVDSFNSQLWYIAQLQFANINGKDPVTLTGATYGTSIAPQSAEYDSVTNSYRGIVVGSGTNPTTINKYTMDSIIDMGSGAGQLSGQVSTVEFNLTSGIGTVTRPFVNLSFDQSVITINEVGITGGFSTGNTKDTVFLFIRDVLQASVIVPYESTLAVQYNVRISNGNNNYKNVFIRPFGINTGITSSERYGLTNTTGSYRTISTSGAALKLIGSEGMTNRGLVFGTSNGDFNVTQNDLLGKIEHGNSAAQLFYNETTNGTLNINTTSNSLFFKFFRSVENRSGSNISISEAGLFTDGGVTNGNFMLDRRVIDPPVTITNGNIISFTWEFCYEV